MGSDSPGSRLYAVRLACGDGYRKAESLDDFSERVRKKTGVNYDPATISLLERMKQQWKLSDCEHLAAVDPLGRGAPWLAFGGSQTDEGKNGIPPWTMKQLPTTKAPGKGKHGT